LAEAVGCSRCFRLFHGVSIAGGPSEPRLTKLLEEIRAFCSGRESDRHAHSEVPRSPGTRKGGGSEMARPRKQDWQRASIGHKVLEQRGIENSSQFSSPN